MKRYPQLNEQLEYYLRSKKALTKFIANVERNYGPLNNGRVQQAFPQGIPDLGGAFVWWVTPEGQDYWMRLSKEFDNTEH